MIADCSHRRFATRDGVSTCTACGEQFRTVEAVPLLAQAPAFCSICGHVTESDKLAPGPGGTRECEDCRELHPRSGRYSFGEPSKMIVAPSRRKGGAA